MSDPAGSLLFARYAYPPNALGLCGTDEPRTLLEHGASGEADEGLASLARSFEGAWPYLELIARANRIPDPLDRRVVEAYWVGNDLLGRVRPRDLLAHLDERFAGRLGRARERLQETVGQAAPHHCFHVFAVYPWVGLLRSGALSEPLRVLDGCRIAPGLVTEVEGDELEALVRPLLWDGARLSLGAPAPRRARWRHDGLAFSSPEVGDWVSLHWGSVCDVLAPSAAQALLARNRQALRAVNGAGGLPC